MARSKIAVRFEVDSGKTRCPQENVTRFCLEQQGTNVALTAWEGGTRRVWYILSLIPGKPLRMSMNLPPTLGLPTDKAGRVVIGKR